MHRYCGLCLPWRPSDFTRWYGWSILISTPTVDLKNRKTDPIRDVLYCGAGGNRPLQLVVNFVKERQLPVLMAYAKYEPSLISDQTRKMVMALAQRDGRLRLATTAIGHNHTSIVSHICSTDQTLSLKGLEFIQRSTPVKPWSDNAYGLNVHSQFECVASLVAYNETQRKLYWVSCYTRWSWFCGKIFSSMKKSAWVSKILQQNSLTWSHMATIRFYLNWVFRIS